MRQVVLGTKLLGPVRRRVMHRRVILLQGNLETRTVLKAMMAVVMNKVSVLLSII
jgi:hypothetical protein